MGIVVVGGGCVPSIEATNRRTRDQMAKSTLFERRSVDCRRSLID
jgi:hypothetical protein